MKKSRKYSFYFAAVLIMTIILNGVISWLSFSSQKYFTTGEKAVSRETVVSSVKFLSGIRYEDYQKASEQLMAVRSDMLVYGDALRRLNGGPGVNRYYPQISEEEAQELFDRYGFTESQSVQKLNETDLCLRVLGYATGYNKDIAKMLERADDMSSVGIFDRKVYRNIVKTSSDMYGLQNLRITAVPDEGVMLLFSDVMSDIAACAAAALCALLYTFRCRSQICEKSRLHVYSGLFAVSAAVMYSVNVFSAGAAVPAGDAGRAVQSVQMFSRCMYHFSVSSFTAVRILYKSAACITVFFIFTVIFSSVKKKKAAVAVLIFAAVEILLYSKYPDWSFVNVFRPEKIFSRYHNVFLFGEPFSLAVIFSVTEFLTVVLWGTAAWKSMNSFVFAVSEKAENEYFEDINKKYTELRLMRHDMKNHLSVIGMLLEAGDSEGAGKYIGEITEELDGLKPPVKTGSGVLDALVFRKFSDAAQKRINISVTFGSDFTSCRFSDYDLCSLFSNIIDNACEACEKLPEPVRNIELSVKEQMNMVCIFCENRYSEINEASGEYVTLKSDREQHGFGIRRIRQIAGKYGGSAEIKTENGVFSVSVILMK